MHIYICDLFTMQWTVQYIVKLKIEMYVWMYAQQNSTSILMFAYNRLGPFHSSCRAGLEWSLAVYWHNGLLSKLCYYKCCSHAKQGSRQTSARTHTELKCTHTTEKIKEEEKDGRRNKGHKEKQVELRKGQRDSTYYSTAHWICTASGQR